MTTFVMPMDHERLDEIFPTLVRYTGLCLSVALTTVLVVLLYQGKYAEATGLAPGYLAATGMVLYKTVRDAARDEK